MSVKQTVLEILKKYPKTRSSDKELFLVFEDKYNSNTNANFFIEDHFNFIRDAIRYRAEIQASWLYPAVKKIKQYRDKKRKVKTREFSDYNWRKVNKEPLVVKTSLTETQINDIRRQWMYLPVTEVTGSKVEEKKLKTGFIWLLNRLWK